MSGTRRPLQVTIWRCGFRPRPSPGDARREESTYRNCAAGGTLLAHHMPGSSSSTQLELHAATHDAAIERKAELALSLEPLRLERDSQHGVSSSSTPRKSVQTKCSSMKRSCKVVPQRTSSPRPRLAPERANERAQRLAAPSSCGSRGGISKEQKSTRPRRPVLLSGEVERRCRFSARAVAARATESGLQKQASVDQPGKAGPDLGGDGTELDATISSS